MKRGDIVLTVFPFTNLSSSKRRPALLLNNPSVQGDCIVGFISSHVPLSLESTDLLLTITDRDFSATGLLKDSVFKMNKLATLDTSLFTGALGYAPPALMQELEQRLRIALQI